MLSGYNGHDLLRMKMKDLERLINHDEAQRLDGHLTLQKNMSGVCVYIFKTKNKIITCFVENLHKYLYTH